MSRVRSAETQGVTFVELFFDLVFVYAVTQLTASVIHDLSWAGSARWAVAFWLVWWAWTQFTWTLNSADTEHTQIRFLTLAATAAAFFLAQAVPDAYGDGALWFASAYVIVRLLGIVGQVWVLGDDEQAVAGVKLFGLWSLVGLALVIAGALLSDDLRPWVWLLAILADLFTASLAGRGGTWALQVGHFAERHGLIVIVALGESLIATGIATAELERDLTFMTVTMGAVLATCALWWMYFGTLLSRFEDSLEQVPLNQKGQAARDIFSLSHAVVVAGVIGVAVGFESAVAHPDEPLSLAASVALAVGAALFASGLAGASIRARIRGVSVPLLLFAGVALGSIPIIATVNAGVALWGLAASATLASIGEIVRSRSMAAPL